VTHPIGAHQRLQRHVALGEPPRVLERGRRCVDLLGPDPVLQQMQQRRDVALDARGQQLHDDVVAPQFGDRLHHLRPDVLADLDQPDVDLGRHSGQQPVDGGAAAVHRVMLGARIGP
jgi:hypothetical protein